MPSTLLQAQRLSLRDLRLSDVDAVHAYASDERAVVHLTWGPNTVEQTRSFVDQCVAEASTSPRRSFNLGVVLEDGELVGACRADVAADGAEAEIGYAFNPRHWGHGYATEAVGRLLEFLFSETGVHRVFATCRPENAASIAVLRRLGLRLEGHLRDHKFVRGRWRDSLIWAQLASERTTPVSPALVDTKTLLNYLSMHPALTMLPQLISDRSAPPAQVLHQLLPLFGGDLELLWSAVLRPGDSSSAQINAWKSFASALTDQSPNSAAQVLEVCADTAAEFNASADELLRQVGQLLFGMRCRFDVAHGVMALGVRESARRLAATTHAFELMQMVG